MGGYFMNDYENYKKLFHKLTSFKENPYHPFVWILGEPTIGDNVYIGGFSEINSQGASILIGDNCDIASFVSINCADSHLKCIELSENIVRKDIILENHIFIGSHSVIKGGAHIGHHSVIAAGTVVNAGYVPPYSLVVGNPMVIKAGYYEKNKDDNDPS
jgi:acetyltransferase-like isoleucine patch superfamily enzyme